MQNFDKSSNIHAYILVVERVPEFSGTRPEPDLFWPTRTRLFQVGYVPDPTRTRPNEPKHKIWIKKYTIPDFLEFPPDPNLTFYYPIYSIPDFLLPALPLVSKQNNDA